MKPPQEVIAIFYVVLGAAWFVTGAVLAQDAARAVAARRDRWPLALALLFAAAFAVRLALATWAPGDDQYRMPDLMEPGFGAMGTLFADFHLGNTPLVLWWPLSAFFPVSDMGLVWVALVLGALAPVLLAAALDELGAPRLGALAAGALLAFQSIPVRFSGTMNRMSYAMFLGLAALWAIARYAHPGADGRANGRRYLVLFVASGLLCARARPEAGIILPVAGLAVLVVHLDAWRRLREARFRWSLVAVAIAGALGVAGLAFAQRYEPILGSHLQDLTTDWAIIAPDRSPWLDLDYTSPVAIGLALGAVVAGLLRRDRVILWAAAGLVLVAAGTPRMATAGLRLAYTRYHVFDVVLFCALGGLAVPYLRRALPARLGSRAGWAVVVVVGAAFLATSVAPLRRVCAPRAMELEFHFIRDALLDLPACAVIYRPFDDDDTYIGGFRDPHILARHLQRGDWREWPPRPTDDACPAYYYHGGYCYVSSTLLRDYPDLAGIAERCEAGLALAGASPERTAELPALQFCGERYTQERYTVGFYRLPDG